VGTSTSPMSLCLSLNPVRLSLSWSLQVAEFKSLDMIPGLKNKELKT